MKLTRRGVLLAGASIWLLPAPARADDADGAILRGLIAREQCADLAYRSAAGAGLPFAILAGQEAEHARSLHTELQALGLKGPRPPRDEGGLDAEPARLAQAAAGAEALAAARALEAALIDAYDGAVRVLAEPAILRTAATVMASHGQHLAVLRRAQG